MNKQMVNTNVRLRCSLVLIVKILLVYMFEAMFNTKDIIDSIKKKCEIDGQTDEDRHIINEIAADYE